MGESLGPASSIPQPPDGNTGKPQHETPLRGGEAAPSDLMREVMRAHRNWAKRYAPWLLEEWANE